MIGFSVSLTNAPDVVTVRISRAELERIAPRIPDGCALSLVRVPAGATILYADIESHTGDFVAVYMMEGDRKCL